MSAHRTIINYFLERMAGAGFNASLGYVQPDLGRAKKDICVELWLSNGEDETWENTELPIHDSALIECYVFRKRNAEDESGQWYDDVQIAKETLVKNSQDRQHADKLWWDSTIILTDYTSPLKQWNNSMSYSPGTLCARIDLQIKFLSNL